MYNLNMITKYYVFYVRIMYYNIVLIYLYLFTSKVNTSYFKLTRVDSNFLKTG